MTRMTKPLDAVSSGPRGKASVRGGPLDVVGGSGCKATTPNQSLELMRDIRPQQPEIPPHAFTCQQYMEKFGLTQMSARNELRKLVETGKLATARRSSMGQQAGGVQRMYWPI